MRNIISKLSVIIGVALLASACSAAFHEDFKTGACVGGAGQCGNSTYASGNARASAVPVPPMVGHSGGYAPAAYRDPPSRIDGGCTQGGSVLLEGGRPVGCNIHMTDQSEVAQYRRPLSEVCGGQHGLVRIPVGGGKFANYTCP